MKPNAFNIRDYLASLQRRARILSVSAGMLLLANGCAFHAHMNAGDKMLASKNYGAALDEYHKAWDDPYTYGKAETKKRIASTEAEWARVLIAESEKQAAAQHPAYALLLAAKSVELTSDSAAMTRARELASQIGKGHAMSVALAPEMATGPAVVQEVAKLFPAGSGVEVLSMGGGIATPSSAGARSFTVLCSEPTVNRERLASTKTVRYITKHNMVDNPEYVSQSKQIEDMQRQIATAQAAVSATANDLVLSDAAVDRDYNNSQGQRYYAIQRNDAAKAQLNGLQDSLKQMRDRLAALPPKVDNPDYDFLTFPVTIWTAGAGASLRVSEQATAGNIANAIPNVVIDEPVKVDFTGEIYAAQPKALVLAKNTVIPADSDLNREIVLKAAERVAGYLRDERQKQWDAMLERAPAGNLNEEQVDQLLTALWMTSKQPQGAVKDAMSSGVDAAAKVPDALSVLDRVKHR